MGRADTPALLAICIYILHQEIGAHMFKNYKKDHIKVQSYRIYLIFIVFVLLLFISVFSISCGVSEISFSTTLDAFFNFNPSNKDHLIILSIRLPRVIAAILIGSSLAISGAIMQGITRNSLADSGLMGINSGAGFALALCFVFFPSISYLQTVLICFIGSTLGAFMVMGISSLQFCGNSSTHLVLAGAAVSMLLTALSQGLSLYFDISKDIMFWAVGGVCAASNEQVLIMLPFILPATMLAMLLSKHISILSLGEEAAKGLGANTNLIHILSSVTVVVLAGISVSVVGNVGFIGLIIPHIAMFFVGADYKWIIPIGALLGSLLMVIADLMARTIKPPAETPIGALIAVIGVPIFLYLSRKQERR